MSACTAASVFARASVRRGSISLLPTISRMALSATSFTVISGSSMLNRYLGASLIRQNTTKSTSTIFSSPLSIRLSSGMSRTGAAVSQFSAEPRMPSSIRLTRVTLGSSTTSIG